MAPRSPPALDAVLASLVLHHLSAEGKRELFRDVAMRLEVGGALLIADIVEPANDRARAVFAEQWNEAIVNQTGEEGLRFFRNSKWNYYELGAIDPYDKPLAPRRPAPLARRGRLPRGRLLLDARRARRLRGIQVTPRPSVQPLAGVRVVNLGWIWAAPALAGAMADMGADVIKIETGRRVDNTRRSGALYKDVPLLNHSSLTLLRGQRSVTLDLANPESRDVALEIIAASDIVVENYRPGTVARWGLDYESVRRARPDVIMVSLSAGGQTGPLSKITTFGSTLSCLTGLDSIQGYFQDEPQAFGTAHIDPLNAYFGLTAALSALRHRERTGQGQYIDLGQWEATTTLFGAPILDYQWNGRVQGTMGNRDVSMAPHGVYPTRGADAWVAIAVENEAQWRSFRRALGGPAWAREPRFADMYRRLRNQDALDERIGAWTKNARHARRR